LVDFGAAVAVFGCMDFFMGGMMLSHVAVAATRDIDVRGAATTSFGYVRRHGVREGGGVRVEYEASFTKAYWRGRPRTSRGYAKRWGSGRGGGGGLVGVRCGRLGFQ